MKKLLLLLLLPILLLSCKKEDINKNNVEEGSIIKLQVSSQYPLIYIKFDYYDVEGNHIHITDNDGQVENVDITKTFSVSAYHGYTLYSSTSGSSYTTGGEGNYYLYLDNINLDIKNNQIYYSYQQ